MPESSNLAAGTRAIPGFYYDPIKKKYFKHAQASSGSEYTASAVLKRQKLDHKTERERRLELVQSNRLRPTLTTFLSNRSICPEPIANGQRALVRRLKHDNNNARQFQLGGRPGKFAYDKEDGNLYIASSRFLSVHSLDQAVSSDRPLNAQIMHMSPVAPLRSEMSSLTWDSTDRMILCTSVGEGQRPADMILKPALQTRPTVIRTFPGTLWCSASSPGSSRYVAAGSGMMICDAESEISRHVHPVDQSDIMTADFSNAHILLCGCRNGDVMLYDIRTSHKNTIKRFQHYKPATGIAKVKTLDMNQVIVSGLRSTLATYDLRYIKRSRPVVEFSGHDNEFDMQVNSLAISNDILVASQATTGIRMWNLDGTPLAKNATKDFVSDLSFEDMQLRTLSAGSFTSWTHSETK